MGNESSESPINKGETCNNRGGYESADRQSQPTKGNTMATALEDINAVIEDLKKKPMDDPRWTAELVHAVSVKAAITGEYPYRDADAS
jgi:hypothetical protein